MTFDILASNELSEIQENKDHVLTPMNSPRGSEGTT